MIPEGREGTTIVTMVDYPPGVLRHQRTITKNGRADIDDSHPDRVVPGMTRAIRTEEGAGRGGRRRIETNATTTDIMIRIMLMINPAEGENQEEIDGTIMMNAIEGIEIPKITDQATMSIRILTKMRLLAERAKNGSN